MTKVIYVVMTLGWQLMTWDIWEERLNPSIIRLWNADKTFS